MTSSWIFGILVFIYICRILVFCLVFSCTTHPCGFSWLGYCNDGFYAYFLMYVHCVHGIIPTQLCMAKLFWTKLIEFKSHRLYSLSGFSELPFAPSQVNAMLYALKFNLCLTSPARTSLVLINTMFAHVCLCLKSALAHQQTQRWYVIICFLTKHDDIIKTFSVLLALCGVIHRLPVDYPHKGLWHGALIFSLIYAWTNGWANIWEAGDFRRHRTHYDVTATKSRRHISKLASQTKHNLTETGNSWVNTVRTKTNARRH